MLVTLWLIDVCFPWELDKSCCWNTMWIRYFIRFNYTVTGQNNASLNMEKEYFSLMQQHCSCGNSAVWSPWLVLLFIVLLSTKRGFYLMALGTFSSSRVPTPASAKGRSRESYNFLNSTLSLIIYFCSVFKEHI